MDPIANPFAPGAGTPPPELAGRDELRESVRIALGRIRIARPAKSVVMVGLRGVGKTVLLVRMRKEAEAAGLQTVYAEAVRTRSLPAILAPQLRKALLRLSWNDTAKDLAGRALRGLAGFASSLKVQYQDIQVGLDFDPEPGLADNGDLEQDLTALLLAAGAAAKKAETALVLFLDELQYVKEDELAALITALHFANQEEAPVTLVGAGLPQLRALTGQAKSYAERLFDFPSVGRLNQEAARRAIEKPVLDQGVRVTEEALLRIFEETRGYPYFLQEWGKHAWDAADESPIGLADVERASAQAETALDTGFFRVRVDQLTRSQLQYLRAMAALGEGPHRSGDIARVLGRPVTALGPTRSKLIAQGMVWSPSHGDTAFTVPLFEGFMTRFIPGADWRS